jgi:hypothetical protein
MRFQLSLIALSDDNNRLLAAVTLLRSISERILNSAESSPRSDYVFVSRALVGELRNAVDATVST